jgi:hypothetical protein
MADTAPATEGAVDPQISTNGTLEPLAQTDVEMKDEPAIDVCFPRLIGLGLDIEE